MAPSSLPSPTSPGPLLPWLLTVLQPMSRTRIKKWLRDGRIHVNGVPTTHFDHPLQPGDRVTVGEATPRGPAPLPIRFQDDAVIVIEKPPGLLTVASEGEKLDTAFARLRAQLAAARAGRPFVVHRLDRETSGLLLFALRPEIRDQLQANWEQVRKVYLAVVEGRPQSVLGVVDNYLVEGRDLRVRVGHSGHPEARRAVSRYRVVAGRGGYTLVEVTLETGRKHQIRVHLAGLGCPVIGDVTYGARSNPAGRLGLHAWRLAFDHPVSGKLLELESPLPDALRRVIE